MTNEQDAMQAGFISAMGQLAATPSQDYLNKMQASINTLSQQTQIKNNAVMLHQIRQVSRAFNDPTLLNTLRTHFDNVKRGVKSTLNSQTSNASKH